MKLSTFTIIFIVLFFVIIISMSMSCAVVPYSPDTLFSHMYPYEGFRKMPVESEYTTYPDNSSIDSKVNNDINDSADKTCRKCAGFDGVFSSPNALEKPIDFMGANKGSPTCKSYGFSNSQGFVCLDKSQIDLLKTRGGNATGGDFQIGGK